MEITIKKNRNNVDIIEIKDCLISSIYGVINIVAIYPSNCGFRYRNKDGSESVDGVTCEYPSRDDACDEEWAKRCVEILIDEIGTM